jgi:Tfp pilus assembly protein PilV
MRANLGVPGRSTARTGSRTRASQRGTSLLETVIATLIVGLLAVGLVEFFAKGRVWFDQEERKRVATLLAQESLERTIAKPYAEIAGWSESRRVETTPYAVTVTVQTGTPQADLKTVRSVVAWQARGGAQRSVSLATLVFDN